MRDMSDSTRRILIQKQEYYKKMADMCQEMINGTSMIDVCRKHDMSLSSFRGRIFKNNNREIVFSQEELIRSSTECLSPAEKILQDVAEPAILRYKPASTIQFADDFEETIESLIDGLPDDRMKEIFRLYYYEDKTLDEISEIYNITTSRVGQIINKARFYLKRRDKVLQMLCGKKKYEEYKNMIDKPGFVEQAMNEIIMALASSTSFGQLCDLIIERLQILKREYKNKLDSDIPEDVSISILGLDVRTYNSIMRGSDIRTVDQLIQTKDEDLKRIRNFGNSCLEDVKKCLMSKGYTKV